MEDKVDEKENQHEQAKEVVVCILNAIHLRLKHNILLTIQIMKKNCNIFLLQ